MCLSLLLITQCLCICWNYFQFTFYLNIYQEQTFRRPYVLFAVFFLSPLLLHLYIIFYFYLTMDVYSFIFFLYRWLHREHNRFTHSVLKETVNFELSKHGPRSIGRNYFRCKWIQYVRLSFLFILYLLFTHLTNIHISFVFFPLLFSQNFVAFFKRISFYCRISFITHDILGASPICC